MRALIKKLYLNLHWILAAFLLIYTIVPFLSPIFFHTDHTRLGYWIQTLYRFMCHQRPERSLFLFGKQLTYSLEELKSFGYGGGVIGYPFIGDETIGYKVAFCIRDTFLYLSMGLTGLFIAAYPKKIQIKWWLLVLAILPMALDGTIQFLSEFTFLTQENWGLDLANPWYLSNNVTRAITGTIFGFAVGLFIFSELKAALQNNEDENNHE